jgi:SAM-dependent methyltransferase
MRCNVCDGPLGPPIFDAGSDRALTSLCELRTGCVRVWSCGTCGHLRGEALPDTSEYYESAYRILLDQDDEDQIYDVQDAKIIYRTEHQIATLLGKLQLPDGALLLDYGCAKASTPKRLLSQRPDLKVHLFDVSEMYRPHWNRFANIERCAVHHTPAHWEQHFDVVTSFFALEHIPEPRRTVAHIASLLNDEGVFYGIVPDTFGNVADFVVIDHVNHFTAPSLHRLLRDAGFQEISIDATAHRGALVFTARKAGTPTPVASPTQTLADAQALARYWATLSERIRSAEVRRGDLPAAVYGSGFYGAYIASTVQRPELIWCFLDRSPFQQGKTLFGKPVVAPEQLPGAVRTLYVGLNPAIARAALVSMEWPHQDQMELIYLEDYGP